MGKKQKTPKASDSELKPNSGDVALGNLNLKVKLAVSKKATNKQRLTLTVSLFDSNNNLLCEDSDFVTLE